MMKRFSLKLMMIFILSLFSSFIYADGVFSKYLNGKYTFEINVPVEKYEQASYEETKIMDLPFVKTSKLIPSKDYFTAFGAVINDGIAIKNKSNDINILVYGTLFLVEEDINEEIIKEGFKNYGLNYNQFIKKYYNGKFPKNIDVLKYEYNKILFIYGENVTYSTIGKNFYVISYIENGKICYRKVMFNKNEDSYVVFDASYLPKDKKFMDKTVTEMANSLKILKIEA